MLVNSQCPEYNCALSMTFLSTPFQLKYRKILTLFAKSAAENLSKDLDFVVSNLTKTKCFQKNSNLIQGFINSWVTQRLSPQLTMATHQSVQQTVSVVFEHLSTVFDDLIGKEYLDNIVMRLNCIAFHLNPSEQDQEIRSKMVLLTKTYLDSEYEILDSHFKNVSPLQSLSSLLVKKAADEFSRDLTFVSSQFFKSEGFSNDINLGITILMNWVDIRTQQLEEMPTERNIKNIRAEKLSLKILELKVSYNKLAKMFEDLTTKQYAATIGVGLSAIAQHLQLIPNHSEPDIKNKITNLRNSYLWPQVLLFHELIKVFNDSLDLFRN